jgi:hypothetical protein
MDWILGISLWLIAMPLASAAELCILARSLISLAHDRSELLDIRVGE